jgi:DNA-binding MarR family transcriptional regulator
VSASTLARDVDAVRRFNRFYTRQIGVLQEKLLRSRFSLTEGRVLYEIAYHGNEGTPRSAPPTAAEIARALDLDVGYLSRILGRFARRRLITRRMSPADARQAHLSLTARGRAALGPLQRLARDEVAVQLRRLSPVERGRVLDAMRLIHRSLEGPGSNATAQPAAGVSEPRSVEVSAPMVEVRRSPK